MPRCRECAPFDMRKIRWKHSAPGSLGSKPCLEAEDLAFDQRLRMR